MELPKEEDIHFTSLEDAEQAVKTIVSFLQDYTEIKILSESLLLKEIQRTNQQLKSLEEKTDQNTLEIKTLKRVTQDGFNTLGAKFDVLGTKFGTLETQMRGGFDSIGQLLQEISNKLDK